MAPSTFPYGRDARLFAWLAALATALAALLLSVPAAAQQVRGYVLGPNDAITVIVYGQNEFNVQTRVKPDGSIVMPLIGKVQAEGKTVIGLADEIGRRLTSGNFLRDPIVNVEVTEYNSRYVRVAGNVGTPGLIPLDRSPRLLDVLLRAGWVRQQGSNYVLLRRAGGGQETRINTDELARSQGQSDLLLEAGDTIYVPDPEVVYVTGQVSRPGAYSLKPGMTVSELLALAGGVGPTGNNNKFSLRRTGQKEGDADQQTKLQAGDIINVRERLF